MRILLVEDDRVIAAAVREQAEGEGHSVDRAARLDTAEDALATAHFDLILLDLMLPDGRGLPFLRRLRAKGNTTPVIIMTALDQISDRIDGLNAGADDYLVKPFSISELLARIRVAFRHHARPADDGFAEYRCGALEVSVERHSVRLAGQRVRLTPTEFRLLARLVRQAGRVVTHRQLLADVWGAEHVNDTHYLRLYMAQLRGKLEDNPAEPRVLLTEPGVGYRLAEPGSHPAEP